MEPARLHDDAAERRAVPAEELRGRVRDDVGAPLDRAVEVRRGDGRVDDERDAVGVRDIREALEVGDLARRVRDRLDEERLGLLGDRRGVVGGIGGAHERGLDAEAAQRDVQLRDGAAVEVRRGHDVVAGAGEAREGDVLRAQARGGGDGAESALEARDALLEARHGGVREARVDVAVLLQGEPGGGIRGVVEDERGRLVDRERAGARDLVGDVARMDGAGLEAEFAVCHGFTLLRPAGASAARRNAGQRMPRRPARGGVGAAQPSTASVVTTRANPPPSRFTAVARASSVAERRMPPGPSRSNVCVASIGSVTS